MNRNRMDWKAPLPAHIAPFAAWMAAMVILPETAWAYAVRSALTAALLLWLRPWRGYGKPAGRHFPLALAAGVAVFALWVLPESEWMRAHFPLLASWYGKIGIIGDKPLPEVLPYAPETAGWPLTVVHLAGSAFVIAVAEEFFWRGFIYRWLIARDFMKVDLRRLDGQMLLISSLVFGFEHDRWLAGFIAGLVYALVMIRTRDIWSACLAHITTNLLLGIFVLVTGAYAFW
ncbi:MAG: CAAX prenyl protease-related protein [Kiritimatiellia bacterium]